MSPVPLLDLRAQYASLRDELRDALNRVAESQQLILGPEVEAFESDAAAYCHCPHAVGCSSGTDALILALMAAGVKPGDEVITSAYTFFATAGSIVRVGATPVFADVEPLTMNVEAPAIERLITPKTRAIMPVHLFGQCVDMAPLLELARSKGIAVIEDAAQAIGSESRGQRAGAMGDMGSFSFYPSKNLGAFGDAGMVTTCNDDLAAGLRRLRVHGSVERYHHEVIGGNFRIDAIQAAVLKVKLGSLDAWTEGRQRNAARYNRLFAEAGVAMDEAEMKQFANTDAADEALALRGSAKLLLPAESPARGRFGLRGVSAPLEGHRHIYNQYVVRTSRRDAVIAALKAAEIGHMIYYPVPLPLQECFAHLGAKPGDFPVSESAAATSLALPIYPELTGTQQEEVVAAVVRGLSETD